MRRGNPRSLIVLPSLILLAACGADAPVAPRIAGPGPRPASGSVSPAHTSSISSSTPFALTNLAPSILIAYGVNDNGLVVGETGGNNIAMAWSQATGFTTVGRLDGTTICCSSLVSVNSVGNAVGFSHTDIDPVVVLRWSANAGTSGLRIYGRDFGQAINDNGVIVGHSPILGSPDVPWYVAPNGNVTLLQLAAPAIGGIARSISQNGLIAGGSDIPGSGGGHAIFWSSPSAVGADLGTLGGNASDAFGINSAGDIVGWSEIAGGEHHAFVWAGDTGMENLDARLNGCAGPSEAYGINEAGVIVGKCNNAPVVWTALEGMRALPLPPGVTTGQARAINSSNVIVGAYNGQSGGAVWTIANKPPVASAGGPYATNEGGSITFDGSASTDPDGDALTYSWTFGDGGTGAGASPTHTYQDNGVFAVTLTVTDSKGASSTTATTSATVANVVPAVGAITVPTAPLQVGTPVSVSATFSDPGALDTHTGSIQWDLAGAFADATITEGAPGSIGASSSSLVPGVYTVTLRVTDKDGGVGQRTASDYLVVYDANGGFVTGGGWILSNAGDCTLTAQCQSASGEATFGFVAKYQHGASAPSGDTEFEFHAGGLSFSSTAYDWLVVGDSQAQFKGTGKLNGELGFNFLITAVDGSATGGDGVDKFRIKIWNATGVVYDNKRGANDDSNASTALGGGSIIIHR